MKKLIFLLVFIVSISNIYCNEIVFKHFINYFFDVKDDFNSKSKDKFNKKYFQIKTINGKIKINNLPYYINFDSKKMIVNKSMAELLVIDNNEGYDFNIIGIRSYILEDVFGEEEREDVDKVFDFYIVKIKDNVVSMNIFIPKYEVKYTNNKVIIIIMDLRFRDLYDSMTIRCVTNMGHLDVYDIKDLNEIDFTDLYFSREYNKDKTRKIENVVIKAVSIRVKKVRRLTAACRLRRIRAFAQIGTCFKADVRFKSYN